MTNKAVNTATPTNKVHSSQSMTWDSADFAWEDAAGTWDNPYNMSNKSVNTASVTNKTLSP